MALSKKHVMAALLLLLLITSQGKSGLATSPSAANGWVQTNISPYLPDVNISYIAAGNEIKPSDPLAQYIGPAMQNLYNAVTSSNFPTQIKVSTVIDMSLMGNTYFKLDYALLNSSGVVVQDGNLGYQNLFYAMMDSLYYTLEKIGEANLTVIVTETGCPSDGGVATTIDNAGTYYKNLISHVNNGTPKRPGPFETYLFALFDEDQKGPMETEKHFGLFSPTKQPKYQLSFS
nr:glucan endo-1,3-beta-glucosidase, basic isoform-like [Quercus suber]